MRASSQSGSIKIWRLPDLDVEMHAGTCYQHPYPRHWHENFYVAAITGGAGHFEFRKNNEVAVSGTLMVIAPGEVHAHHDVEGGRSFRSMHPTQSSSLAKEFADLPSGPIIDRPLFRKFLELHRAMEVGGNKLERDLRLCDFFRDLNKRAGKRHQEEVPQHEPAAVRRALELLHEHYHREISLQELAAAVNLSPYHFHRVFCRQTGMPPHAYQIQLRIMRARAMVREQVPLAHIAALTGFFDQSHFTHHFKRLLGITPSLYAQL